MVYTPQKKNWYHFQLKGTNWITSLVNGVGLVKSWNSFLTQFCEAYFYFYLIEPVHKYFVRLIIYDKTIIAGPYHNRWWFWEQKKKPFSFLIQITYLTNICMLLKFYTLDYYWLEMYYLFVFKTGLHQVYNPETKPIF